MVLPTAARGNFVGSAIMKFDETGCEAMFLSLTASKLYSCNGNYVWTFSTFTKINGPVVKVDLQLFLI